MEGFLRIVCRDVGWFVWGGCFERFLFERRWIAGISFVRFKGNCFVIFLYKIRIVCLFYNIRNFPSSLLSSKIFLFWKPIFEYLKSSNCLMKMIEELFKLLRETRMMISKRRLNLVHLTLNLRRWSQILERNEVQTSRSLPLDRADFTWIG